MSRSVAGSESRGGRWSAARALGLAAGLLVVALSTLSSAACGSGGVEPSAVSDSLDMRADNVIYNLQQWLTKDGVRNALLKADTAYVYNDSAIVKLKVVHVTMYTDQGVLKGTLSSDRGVVDQRTQAMTATGHVVLINSQDSVRVETEVLHYDPNGNRIWSDMPTTFTQNKDVVHGTGFTSDAAFKNVHIDNPRGTAPGARIKF